MAQNCLSLDPIVGNKCDLTVFDFVFSTIHDSGFTWFRITVLILCGLMVFAGNGCTIAIWHYERYWGDPKKRIIINRIGIHLVYTCILGTMTSIVNIMFVVTFGPLPTLMVQVTYMFTNRYFATVGILALNEIAILRFLSLTIWKRIPPVDEDFFSHFFLILNFLIGFCFACWGFIGRYADHEMYWILTGLPLLDCEKPSLWLFTSTFLVTCFIHIIYGSTSAMIKTQSWMLQSNNNPEGDISQNSHYNNFRNKDITNLVINVIAVGSFIFHLVISKVDWEPSDVVPIISGFVIPMFTMTFILPMKTVVQNPEIWRHLLDI